MTDTNNTQNDQPTEEQQPSDENQDEYREIMVEIIAKKKGCMLCDLALGILEEIAPEFEEGVLQWTVVDISSKEGLMRQAELRSICTRMPAVPSIVINERIAFDNIPDMEALSEAVKKALHPEY